MIPAEQPIVFTCQGESLLGMLAAPASPAAVGVLIIVGGPQYRAGSHRQFVLLARALAAAGYPCFRFDHRGMGDSTGEAQDFSASGPDIAAALDAFMANSPGLQRVVLWGLCDAASTSLMYWHETRDPRVAGMVLLNPWMRSEQTLAQARIRYYYLRRLLDRDFWAKIRRGGWNPWRSLQDLLANLRRAGRPDNAAAGDFRESMLSGWRTFPGPSLLILSGNDMTAAEFLTALGNRPDGPALLARPSVTRVDVAGADHTFAKAAWRDAVLRVMLAWLHKEVR
ncbi:MAG: hydrolase 1, exosortase A system-associated [Betaproteobacteria bacterium HGW-Betaproteobacteria-12]|nr:MAG: hydrolase 1, exosortase A system-associated [Betaproteobacteria bacterium HGW-Betaproteobacteria-12]